MIKLSIFNKKDNQKGNQKLPISGNPRVDSGQESGRDYREYEKIFHFKDLKIYLFKLLNKDLFKQKCDYILYC